MDEAITLMFAPWRRLTDFSGRSRRKEYWLFILKFGLALFSIMFLEFDLGLASEKEPIGPLALVLCLLFVWPAIACQVRRLHDQDISGWWALIQFVPYVGTLILLYFMARAGTVGNNRFGPDSMPDRIQRI